MKKMLSVLLCVIMVVTMMPVTAFASGSSSPQAGDYQFTVGMPSMLNTWLPGVESNFWTRLEQWYVNPDNPDYAWWNYVGDYTVEPSVTTEHHADCTSTESAELVRNDWDDPTGFSLRLSGDCIPGCRADVAVIAKHNDEVVGTDNFSIHVSDTMYWLDANGLKSNAVLGQTVDFKNTIYVRKDTWNNGNIQSELVNNPQVEMSYPKRELEAVGAEVNGLYDLKKVSPYGADVYIKVYDENNTVVAGREFFVNGYDFQAYFAEGNRRAFTNQESVTFTLVKNNGISQDTNHTIGFVLGTLDDNWNFTAIADQTGLFETVKDTNGSVTGIKLYPGEIAKKVTFDEENGECRLGVQTTFYSTTYPETVWTHRTDNVWLLQEYLEYDYNLPDELYMLPHNGRGIGNSVGGSVRNENYPDWADDSFDIIEVTASPEGIVDVYKDGNWQIDAVALGNATITMKHEGFSGETVTKTFNVHVKADLWRCDVEPVTGTNALHPGESLTFTADAQHRLYDAERDYNYPTDEDYVVEWSLSDTENGRITMTSAGKSVTITAAANASFRNYMLNYTVYAVDEDGNKTGGPVCEGGRDFHVTDRYYTFEINGFNENLAVGDEMTVTCEMIRHSIENGVKKTVPINASFDCGTSSADVISVDESSTATKATYVITRISEYDTDIYFEARFNDGYGDNDWGRGFWLADLRTEPTTAWAMFYSEKPLPQNAMPEYLDQVNNRRMSMGENDEKFVYLYAVEFNRDDETVVGMEALTTEEFNVKYALAYHEDTPPTHIPSEGIRIVKADDGKGSNNYYKITSDSSDEPKYAEGTKNYDIWPVVAGRVEDFYSFNVEPLYPSLMFADKELDLSEDLTVLAEDIYGGFDLRDGQRVDRYLYLATFIDNDFDNGLASLKAMTDADDFKIRFCVEDNGDGPIWLKDENGNVNEAVPGLTINQKNGNLFEITADFDQAFIEEDNQQQGYDVRVGDSWNAWIGIRSNKHTELNFSNTLLDLANLTLDTAKEALSSNIVVRNGKTVEAFLYIAEYIWTGYDDEGWDLFELSGVKKAVGANAEFKAIFQDQNGDAEYHPTESNGKDLVVKNVSGNKFSITYNQNKDAHAEYPGYNLALWDADNNRYAEPWSAWIDTLGDARQIFMINPEDAVYNEADHTIATTWGPIYNLLEMDRGDNKTVFEGYMGYIIDAPEGDWNDNTEITIQALPVSEFTLTKAGKVVSNAISAKSAGNDYLIAIKLSETGEYIVVTAEQGDFFFDDNTRIIIEEATVTPPSGGGGGGYIPPTPSTPKDEVTNNAGTTTAVPTTNADMTQSTTMKGNETTTTVDQTVADKIVENAVANKSEEVVINATSKNESAAQSTKAAEVELPADTLAQIAEKTEADVTIKTDVAEIKLDNAAAAAVAEQAEGATVSIVAEKVKESAKEVRVELKIVCSEGKTVSDFKGGNISVTVQAPKGNKDVVCVYIDEQGHMHKVPGQLNADGTYTFTTGHFSTYAIMDAEEAEAAIEAQKAAVKEMKFKLKSKLVTTKKGKKAIKLTWNTGSDLEFDGVAIYRSTKKNSGYGKKPFYTAKSDYYINTAVKAGKKYYYKVRGFVYIDGEKVYTQYSNKAWRTVK